MRRKDNFVQDMPSFWRLLKEYGYTFRFKLFSNGYLADYADNICEMIRICRKRRHEGRLTVYYGIGYYVDPSDVQVYEYRTGRKV